MGSWAGRARIGGLAVILTASLATAVPGPAGGGTTPTGSRPAAGPVAAPEAEPLATARRTGKSVEVDALRTETTRVFANPSGSLTMEQHVLPVRVRRGNGWVPVDTTLKIHADGSVQPAATAVDIHLSGGGTAPLVTLGGPDAQLRLGWPAPLPAPRLDGDTATYPEVLPGVDLQVRVDEVGFSQVLVVKDQAAARHPALRRLRFPLTTSGLTVRTTADGTTIARDHAGKPVFTAGTPMMWDTPVPPADARERAAADVAGISAPHRQAPMAVAFTGTDLVVTPDQAMLAAADTRYPVSIDPSFAGAQYRWTFVNKSDPTRSYWSTNREDGARVGYQGWSSPYSLYRSFFQLDTARINGSRVRSAYFAITLDHTADCALSPADLWHTRPIDPASALTWNNSGSHWLSYLATASGKANEGTACPQPDMGIEFASAALKNLVQSVADARTGYLPLGLRAPLETSKYQWKRFHPNTARIVVEYNNVPHAPSKLTMTRPVPCGTAATPAPVNTTQPQFSAVGYDADGQNITSELQIYGSDGVLAHSVTSTATTSGAAFSWPVVPAGKLAHGGTYHYRARSTDGLDPGPFSGDCYFVVDTVAPQTPTVTSTDYPDGQAVIPTRTAGTVTFRAQSGDTDVTEFRYGFQQDTVTMRVKAGADGTATVPITIWPDPVTGVPSRRLYVRTADAAGNTSPVTTAWNLTATTNPAPVPHLRNDTNGDGRGDVTAVVDHGFDRTAVWNVVARDGGFHTGTMAWDSGQNGGFPATRTRTVSGDFTGDGRTDLAVFREEPNRRVSLYLLESDGNRYEAASSPLWTGGAGTWTLARARIAAGDVDADGRDDVAVQVDDGNGNWHVAVFRGSSMGAPTTWLQAPAGSPAWLHATPLLADIDGDGRADLVSMRNAGGCRTTTVLHQSTGTGFTATPVTLHDSAAGAHCWERATPVVGDVTGDGRDDLVVMYDHGTTDTALWVFQSTGSVLTAAEWWRAPTGVDAAKTVLTTADVDADGRDDAALVQACCTAGSRQVWTLRSTGTAFAAPSLGWQESVDAVAGPRRPVEHRSYELLARHSRRCLQVPGGATADGQLLDQWDCAADTVHERFHLVPVPGTDRYSLKAVHSVKCAGVAGSSTADGAAVTQTPCDETLASQQFTFQYVDGGADTVMQLRFAHSGKCAAVAAGDTANGADVVQQPCTDAASQQWVVRPAYNVRQLDGLYRITSQVGGKVLDVQSCATADGANVQVWDWTGTSRCQRWTVRSLGDDEYQIIDTNSGKALDIAGCSTANEAVATIWTPSDSVCQRWRIEPAGGGSYSIFATNTGKALDIKSCSTAAGADVILWPYRGATCQRYLIAPENLAFRRPVTVSSIETASFPGPYAVDGSTTTRWSTLKADPQSIQIDLGATKRIGRVKLLWETAYAKSYRIETSDDGVTWTTIYSTTTGNGATDDLTGLTGSGRYVRAVLTVRGTTYSYSLWEFEVYAPN